MDKIRPILRPLREGTNVTLSQARAAFRELDREARAKKKAHASLKPAAKAR